MNAKLAIAIATAGVTLGVAAAPAMAGTVRQNKTTITIGVVHKADGTWFTGKVSTPRARNGEAGRSVALFARGSVIGNGDITGSTRGHSAGYWQIKVSRFAGISSTRLSAFVFDKIHPGLTNPQIDELPAQSVSILYSNGAVVGPGNAVSMNKGAISILPVLSRPDGFWFTGKVTNAANGAPERDHLVMLFTHGRSVGQNTSGTTRGHSAGYWQIKVNGFAGISLSYFDAYAFDRFYPGLLVDELPAQSPTIQF